MTNKSRSKHSVPSTQNFVEDNEWSKHIVVMNNRVYRISDMRDITHQKRIMVNGFDHNLRRAVFFLLNNRWPSKQFSLPWEE